MCRPPFAVMGVFDVADRKELVGLTLFLDARLPCTLYLSGTGQVLGHPMSLGHRTKGTGQVLSLAVRAEKGF